MVSALLTTLGNQGTLVAYVDYEPIEDLPYFDPINSPACREYGILAAVIRTWPGSNCSLNPGASIASIGARSEFLCNEHPLNYGYGPGSPYAKLV